MKISQLIASSVKDLLTSDPQRLGVRLCPITLTSVELAEAVRELRRALGPRVFIVGSAPGVAVADRERTLVAPDHQAAERATEWRNTVDVSSGEHLIYVSVEEHPKASGLHDCLVPLRERDLRTAFRAWCDNTESGMPQGFADALRDAGLTEQVRVAALCDLVNAVQKSGDRAGSWDVVGKNLPLIGLAADTRLSKKDAAERLSANAKVVRSLETGETRTRTRKGPLGEAEAELQRALAEAKPEKRASALASVDLRSVTTSQLAPSKKPARPVVATAKRGSAKPTGRRAPVEAARVAPVDQPPAPNGDRVLEIETPTTDELPHPSAREKAKESVEPSRLVVPRLPGDLAVLLPSLLADEGHPVEVLVRVGTRDAFVSIPKTAKIEPRRADRVARALPELFARHVAARRAFIIAALDGRAESDAAALLTFAMARLLERPSAEDALRRHVEATSALYEGAIDVDAETMREVLALDTCAVRDASGVVARLFGPTHLLAIGQRQARSQAMAGLSETVRQRVARALEAAPPAPQECLEDGGTELFLSRPEAGLLVFERAPDSVPDTTLIAVGEALLSRYLELSPHALLGARVVVDAGREAGPLIEGLARAAASRSGPSLRSLDVLCVRSPVLPRQGTAQRLIESGLLRLGPRPPLESARPPHIVIRAPRATRRGDGQEPAAPARAAFSPPASEVRTQFEVRDGRLRVRTSISGIGGLESFEALHAAASGRVAQKAFIRDTLGVSLRAHVEHVADDEATWHALVAPSIGRRPPLKSFLLVHERVDDTTACAVVSRDVRPAVRAIQEGLRNVGLREERPRALQLLAVKLAEATRSGLLSLRHSGEQLIAGGLLATEIARRARGAVIAPIEGAAYEALVGEVHDARGVALLGVTAETGSLSFVVGYATLDAEVDVDLSRAQVGGTLGRRLAHAVGTIHAALADDGPASAAAREALSWLIWPALAVDGVPDPRLAVALAEWRGDPQAVEVVCMLPPNLSLPRGRSVRIVKTPVSVLAVDVDLLNRLVLTPS
jgi:hypothetical protein